jgi:hypothetical protein
MSKFTMSQYATKESLYRDKANYYESLYKSLQESVLQAIRSGDWNVDGRNDPAIYLEELGP